MSACLVIFIILLAFEAVYIHVAERFGVSDCPNRRSSHNQTTVRGGGLVFVAGAIAFSVWSGWLYPLFLVGLVVIAAVSFADDLRGAPIWLRLAGQFAGMALVMAQADSFALPAAVWLAVLVVGVAFLNAYNFMDGINGSAGLYTLVALGSLGVLNHDDGFIDWRFLCEGLLAAVVFCIFNVRTRARCFAGDVGSLAMGATVLFPLLLLIEASGCWAWIVLVSVYGTDAALTILRRIAMRKNIFEAHRMHAYQLLCNELGHSHLAVAAAYAAIQLAINAGAIFLPVDRYVYLIAVVSGLSAGYIGVIKYSRHQLPVRDVRQDRKAD